MTTKIGERSGTNNMKIAYVFANPHAASYKLAQMILPQLQATTHGATVVGMFFLDDNVFVLRKGDPVGEGLSRVAREQDILLMMCDLCALSRNLAEGAPCWVAPVGSGIKEPARCVPVDTVEGVQVGCFPNLYSALSGNPPDHIITL